MASARINDQVAIVVYDGLTALEYAIPMEVFGLYRPELPNFYTAFSVAAEPGPIRGSHGLQMQAERELSDLSSAGTIILPGWRERFELPPKALINALVEAHSRGARLLSICSGAFVLAATGLLNGRRATTHWMYADDLRKAYPQIEVDESALYIDEGSLLTGAGSAAGIDACLHLVREDWGTATVNTVARRLVTSPHRDGGQAQFIVERRDTGFGRADASVAALMESLLLSLDNNHTLESMAASLHISPRTLVRRFQQEVGCSPVAWLVGQRIRRSCLLLEETNRQIESIAGEVGFTSVASFRVQFKQRMKVSPREYRRRFSGRGPK